MAFFNIRRGTGVAFALATTVLVTLITFNLLGVDVFVPNGEQIALTFALIAVSFEIVFNSLHRRIFGGFEITALIGILAGFVFLILGLTGTSLSPEVRGAKAIVMVFLAVMSWIAIILKQKGE